VTKVVDDLPGNVSQLFLDKSIENLLRLPPFTIRRKLFVTFWGAEPAICRGGEMEDGRTRQDSMR
jgi:hypothetical protein